MSGLHVYCIVPPAHAPAAGTAGVAERPVALLSAGPVALWYSLHDEPPAADEAALRSHNAVIEAALTAAVTPVPARFGQWFDTAAEAEARVAAAADHWLDLLRSFAGHAEYGVRFSFAEAPAGAPAPARDVRSRSGISGTEYMASLMQRHAQAARRREEAHVIADAIAHRVGGVAALTRVDLDAPGGFCSLSHLVAHCDRDTYHERLEGLRRERPDLQCLFTGPWPPYSFAG